MHGHVARQERVVADRRDALADAVGGRREAAEPVVQVDAGMAERGDHALVDAALPGRAQDLLGAEVGHAAIVVADDGDLARVELVHRDQD